MDDADDRPADQDADVAAIESALSTIVGRARLPEAHARVTRATGIDLDRAAYVVLNRVGEWEPLRLSDLAERLGIQVPTASQHIKRLEASGHVERSPDPDDGRASLLGLTSAGREAVAHIARFRRERVAELLAGWSSEDRHELARLLDRLVTTLTSP